MASTFLDLPPEVRVEIYKYVFAFTNDQAIPICRQRRSRMHKYLAPILRRAGKEFRTPDLSLLCVCRTVYQEAVGTVYQNSRVGFWLWDNQGHLNSNDHIIGEVSMFARTFENHLQFIQHLDLGLQDFVRFIPGPINVDDGATEVTAAQTKVNNTLSSLMDVIHNGDGAKGSAEEHRLFRFLDMLAGILPNVRSITYHQHWTEDYNWVVPSPRIEGVLKDHFPNLEEVRILNKKETGLKMTILDPRMLAK